MGLLLYAQGVTDRWQRRQGQKWKRCCGRYSYLHSVSYLTLMAGDKGIKCLSTSPRRCRKGTVGGATACHDGNLVSAACHSVPLAAQPPATYARKGPRATCRWVIWSAGTEWLPAAASALPRPLSCRVRELVARRVLPGRVARRGRFFEMLWSAFPASSSCRGLVPRAAFPASSSCRGLVSLAKILCSRMAPKEP